MCICERPGRSTTIAGNVRVRWNVPSDTVTGWKSMFFSPVLLSSMEIASECPG
jgi:hypothetical protein